MKTRTGSADTRRSRRHHARCSAERQVFCKTRAALTEDIRSTRSHGQIGLRRLAIFLNGSLSAPALRRTAKVVRFRSLAIISALHALKTSSRSSLSRSGVQGRRGVLFISPFTFSPQLGQLARASETCRTTNYPCSAAGRHKEHCCHPSLRIWKLVCNDCHRNRECCYSAHQSCQHTALVKKRAKKGYHFPFTFSPISTRR